MYGSGARVMPILYSEIDGSVQPSSGKSLNLCIRLVAKRNNSILASASPRHTRRPVKRELFIGLILKPGSCGT